MSRGEDIPATPGTHHSAGNYIRSKEEVSALFSGNPHAVAQLLGIMAGLLANVEKQEYVPHTDKKIQDGTVESFETVIHYIANAYPEWREDTFHPERTDVIMPTYHAQPALRWMIDEILGSHEQKEQR